MTDKTLSDIAREAKEAKDQRKQEKAERRLSSIMSSRDAVDGGHLVHKVRTMSYQGKVHSLAKLVYMKEKGLSLDEVEALPGWIRRTCQHPLCTAIQHLELGNAGAVPKTDERRVQEELERQEAELMQLFGKPTKAV